ncbi:MAG TPA: GIY-YIG nuclease family protein, partial [Stellaceae bacterium]|nr:GIY-YIG nuclease family protein [Stellaceae bacterium]
WSSFFGVIMGFLPVGSTLRPHSGGINASAISVYYSIQLVVFPAKAGTHCAAGTMSFVYILASKPYGTLYVGSTVDLARRVWEHKNKALPGFTAKYGVDRLVWYEAHELLEIAWARERQIKEWKRDWKIAMIECENPHWIDLYTNLSPP